jgi:hypothetical protein
VLFRRRELVPVFRQHLHHPQDRLVNERRRLESLTGTALPQVERRKLSHFVANGLDERVERRAITATNRAEQCADAFFVFDSVLLRHGSPD